DPGPTSALGTLRTELTSSGISIGDITSILLTHIHLDHAGATGTIVRQNPRVRVYVHEIGAPHMASPEKLLTSAARLYGDAMDRLWGEMVPVPKDVIVPLKGGEQIREAGRELETAYTPGHASHHVSFFSRDIGIAFVGDTAGIRMTSGGYVLPPTPPPDIDLEAWDASLARIEAWRPETLFLTHFGSHGSPVPHIVELRQNLSRFSALVRASFDKAESDEARAGWFASEVRREMRTRMSEADADAHETV